MKKLLTVFIFFVVSSTQFFANGQNIDSLKQIAVSNNLPDSNRMDAYYLLASIHFLENSDTTEYFVLQALEIAEKAQNLDGLGQGYGWMGYLCTEKGNIKKAIDYTIKSLYIAEKLGYKGEYAVILNNLAELNVDLENYDLGLEYYKECVTLNTELEHRKSLGANYNNIGLVYRNKTLYDSALFYYEKSLIIRKEENDEKGLAATLSNIGSIYELRDSLDIALNYYQESLAIRERNKINKGIALVNSKIANILFQKKQLNAALTFSNQGFEIAHLKGYKYEEKEAAKVLYKIYKEKGKVGKALEYFEIYSNLHDSIHNIKNQEALIQSKFQFEYNNKRLIDSLEKEKIIIKNQLLLQENKVNEKNLSLQRLWLTISIIGILMLCSILFLIRKNNRIAMDRLRSEVRLKFNETIELRNQLNASKEANRKDKIDLNVVLNDKLSTREQEVLDALILGLTNKQIAEKLFISVNTIKTHVLSLYAKLDVNNRTQAAIKGSLLKMTDEQV